ncbi:MAG: molybdenum cofactor biosynthesis protein MoaE [Akkermansiaceae bacterium]|nr:molybdenum cofactor biosynthesis protein MoaE [Akkermansiaceae bacterium]
MSAFVRFELQETAIDIPSLLAALEDPAVGAVVSFDGRIRNHNDGHHVVALAYQAYPALALSTGEKILSEEAARHEVRAIVAVHRCGPIAIGESAVWVGVAAEHRKAAFRAAEAVMERLKYELPIWKKETYGNGSSEWVGPDNLHAATGEARGDLPEWKATLRQIWISPGNDFRGHHGGPRGENGIASVGEVECIAGMGLRGDRYFGYKPDFKGQVTFMDADVIDAVGNHTGRQEITGGEFRRNLIVSGVRLGDWVGRRFLFQGITFEGTEECKPCYWMDKAVAPGTEEFLKDACRGGLRARILSDGILRVSANPE